MEHQQLILSWQLVVRINNVVLDFVIENLVADFVGAIQLLCKKIGETFG